MPRSQSARDPSDSRISSREERRSHRSSEKVERNPLRRAESQSNDMIEVALYDLKMLSLAGFIKREDIPTLWTYFKSGILISFLFLESF